LTTTPPEIPAAADPVRLDVKLAELGLARSRSHAVQLIKAGKVLVNATVVTKPARPVEADEIVSILPNEDLAKYVSRGAVKLVRSLDEFGVDPKGKNCLDIGASTGGFTQVLLERGAEHVVALDVGHGQLDPRVAEELRVTNLEGYNIRDLTLEDYSARTGAAELPTLVVSDVSFISLQHVFPAVRLLADAVDGLQFVALIKPQFELGKRVVKSHRGVLQKPKNGEREFSDQAIELVKGYAKDNGFELLKTTPSPIQGEHGNHEVLALFSHSSAAQ
jgi:23S rRNA (cytidine1920-2'-O)/16S rRNA (cytidine1409-2'-O)-methyltransferase